MKSILYRNDGVAEILKTVWLFGFFQAEHNYALLSSVKRHAGMLENYLGHSFVMGDTLPSSAGRKGTGKDTQTAEQV